MSQIFSLKLATDSLISDAQRLAVTVQQLLQIEVKVTAEMITDSYQGVNKDYLSLNYNISLPTTALAEQLQWSSWHKDKVGFDDYLWEQTCLECFITSHAKSYVEINASPDGRYALYQFADYRNPSTLPPLPLLRNHSTERASIRWNNDKTTSNSPLGYQRRFWLSLDELANNLLTNNNHLLIHPCVILYFGDTALYFASAHASPADFHNRHYWSALY